MTAGGDAASYGTEPESVISAPDVMHPIELIFRYCHMDVLGTVFTTSMPGHDPKKYEVHAREILDLAAKA
nr:hypothetical protein [Faecalibaculum rodentium]